MITVGPEILDQIRRHAEETYPHECCGILIGALHADGRKDVDRKSVV